MKSTSPVRPCIDMNSCMTTSEGTYKDGELCPAEGEDEGDQVGKRRRTEETSTEQPDEE